MQVEVFKIKLTEESLETLEVRHEHDEDEEVDDYSITFRPCFETDTEEFRDFVFDVVSDFGEVRDEDSRYPHFTIRFYLNDADGFRARYEAKEK